jgi:hypothetical protein
LAQFHQATAPNHVDPVKVVAIVGPDGAAHGLPLNAGFTVSRERPHHDIVIAAGA